MKTPKFWSQRGGLSRLLFPLSLLYKKLSKRDLRSKEKRAQKLPKPVIVIGNINAGGTGKTPATIALTQLFIQNGWKVGVLTRGYGRKSRELILSDTVKMRDLSLSYNAKSDLLGDEPTLILEKTGAKMAVFHNRYEAGRALLEAHPELDLFICDDALQHRQLARDIEIIVVGKQLFGNGYLLPAGPLREPLSRLNSADYILANNLDKAATERLKALTNTPIVHLSSRLGDAYNLKTGEIRPLKEFKCHKLHAAAGIAHPENFFEMLKAEGIHATLHPFPDHHNYQAKDFSGIDSPIFITEKDAVKCQALPNYNFWVVPLLNEIDSQFHDKLLATLKEKRAL